MNNQIRIFDTTLRDGEQAPGCSMDLAEKIEIAQALERMKVDVIEAGFAIASQGDFISVQTIARTLKHCTVASLSRATKKDIETAWEAVRDAKSPLIHTFLATSPTHMQYKLKMSEQEVLEAIAQMVAHARNLSPQVEFSAEDAMRSDPAFLAKAVDAAIRAGAQVINIPDTVGYATPDEMAAMIRYLKQNVNKIDTVTLSVHCHNDLGMAVSNSLAAVQAGATQVEGTINGIGERAGNAALEEIVMAMHT
ncbi:MAG: 2-isopropylmalate synthase, partial [Candidatus Limiplasma sp.]|nr:2-isopropylmalate synthase [Candidatus Limiplasma sp.]